MISLYYISNSFNHLSNHLFKLSFVRTMTLLWLALAYFFGLLAGRWLWDAGGIRCDFPSWLWMVGLFALPFAPLINYIPVFKPSILAMRWPARAHFQPVRQALSPALLVALLITAITGVFHYISHPHRPCYAPDALAYYNLPIEQSFDNRAPKLLITGYVSSYPWSFFFHKYEF